MEAALSPEYDAELRAILVRRDWEGLREFTRLHNKVPDDIYAKDQHFWEVMLHKLTCSRIDTLGLHDESRKWLADNGYSADLGGY
ncbi:MAG: hypothetical protein M3Y21_08485 [Candidatus Eremiobacteraeota bacterium]|nr:hypothetical protein [Candidatus Eremiobacteraeota bacterium]